MTFSFDFGLEGQGVPYAKAAIVMLFESDTTPERLAKTSGPAAVAYSSRFIELFETQIGIIPHAAGIYAEIIGGRNSALAISERATTVLKDGKKPIIISKNRKVSGLFCRSGIAALWGKLGRNECNEAKLLSAGDTILAGVRAATNIAFKSVKGEVVLLTARDLMKENEKLREALSRLNGPMHLSIDLDVLAPGTVPNSRAIEPGGLDWYTLVDTLEALFGTVKINSVDVTGTEEIASRSPAGHLGAQLVLKLAGLLIAQTASP